MKNVKKLLVGCIALGMLTGCGTKDAQVDEKEKETEPKIVANCEVRECIKQIKVTNTVEEINEIIGFEGEKKDDSEKYTWKLSDKTSISLESTANSQIIQATIDKETIKSDEVDLSVYSDLKKLLDNGKSFTYKQAVEKLGGVEGTLAGRTSTSDRYIWVNKNGQTFSATFKTGSKGKCSIMSLR